MHLTLKITLNSDSLIASGEGYGSVIDSDIVFDELGIPYIPAKRIKGCLRDSLQEIAKIFCSSTIDKELALDKLFGNNNKSLNSLANFSNLKIKDYENNSKWLNYIQNEFSEYVSSSIVTSFFTDIRQQTCIADDGVSQDHSLRTSRVLKKGLEFEGKIEITSDDTVILDSLLLACVNLRKIGSNRTRGFGEISCEIYDNKDKELSKNFIKNLEATCKA